MTTSMITLKMDSKFLGEIDGIVKSENYQNRTEFIRAALRKEVDKARMQKSVEQLCQLRGASKTRTTDEELERIRENVAKEYAKRLG